MKTVDCQETDNCILLLLDFCCYSIIFLMVFILHSYPSCSVKAPADHCGLWSCPLLHLCVTWEQQVLSVSLSIGEGAAGFVIKH